MKNNKKAEFMEHFASSLRSDLFVKATLGNYRGTDPQLQRLYVRRIATKKGIRLSFLYRYQKRDIVKNYEINEGLALLRDKIGSDFFSGHLFTKTADYQLGTKGKGRFALHKAKATFLSSPPVTHDRTKKSTVDPASFFLKALSVTSEAGEVFKGRHDKWKQINKFVEVLEKRIAESGLAKSTSLKMVDMGCGKGYLTFAAYDYLKNTLHIPSVTVLGVDENQDLTSYGNQIAESCGFSGLTFETGSIKDHEISEIDILVALHACDTATDDAIFKGVEGGASLILVSPCCHRELRPQLKAPEGFRDILAHGTLLERQSELITDGLRALLLQERGFETKVFEFVPTAHTPKNNMISAVKSARTSDSLRYRRQIETIKNLYDIQSLRLETLLAGCT